jgi:hypothetical protein
LASPPIPHQYIERETTCVVTEHLIADPLINRLYSHGQGERSPVVQGGDIPAHVCHPRVSQF